MRSCPNCGYSSLKLEDKKCPNCKRKLLFKCQKCGKELIDGRSYLCADCKTKRDKIVIAWLLSTISLIVIACVVYVFIPFDIVPDWIPLAGFLDDIIIAIVGCTISIFLAVIVIVKNNNIKKISEENKLVVKGEKR